MVERTIVIEEDILYEEDYQMNILKRNKIEGLLDFDGQGINNKSIYKYDVTGKIPLEESFMEREMKIEDIREILSEIKKLLMSLDDYLLNIHSVILEPKYIYTKEGRYYFCYNPLKTGKLWETFHKFTEYLVKKAEYKNEMCMRLVFALHKGSMDSNYSVLVLIDEALRMITPYDEEDYKKSKIIEDDKSQEIVKGIQIDTFDYEAMTGSNFVSEAPPYNENHAKRRSFFKRKNINKWGNWEKLINE